MIAEDVPMVFFDTKIFRSNQTFIRVTTFLSEDRSRVEQIVERSWTPAGPWIEARRYL